MPFTTSFVSAGMSGVVPMRLNRPLVSNDTGWPAITKMSDALSSIMRFNSGMSSIVLLVSVG